MTVSDAEAVAERVSCCAVSGGSIEEGKGRTEMRERSRWRHRGDVRDALDRTIPTILETRIGFPAFSLYTRFDQGRNS